MTSAATLQMCVALGFPQSERICIAMPRWNLITHSVVVARKHWDPVKWYHCDQWFRERKVLHVHSCRRSFQFDFKSSKSNRMFKLTDRPMCNHKASRLAHSHKPFTRYTLPSMDHVVLEHNPTNFNPTAHAFVAMNHNSPTTSKTTGYCKGKTANSDTCLHHKQIC